MAARAADLAVRDLHRLEDWARQDSPVHSLDPRAKVLALAVFLVAVASFPRYEVQRLLPFTLFPALLLALGGIPAGDVLRRALWALPFALALGLLNPLLDREPHLVAGRPLAGGWLSLASLLLRALLCVSATLAMVATTGFARLCAALERLGTPAVLAVQMLFLHRYAFVLAQEVFRAQRAHTLRAHGRPLDLATFGSLAGHLLLRTFERARRIHAAMLSRGFQGELTLPVGTRFRLRDGLFLLAWALFFLAARLWDLPGLLGRLAAGVLP